MLCSYCYRLIKPGEVHEARGSGWPICKACKAREHVCRSHAHTHAQERKAKRRELEATR